MNEETNAQPVTNKLVSRNLISGRLGLSSAILYFTLYNLIGIIFGILILLILSIMNIDIDLNATEPNDSTIYLDLAVNALAIFTIGSLTFIFNKKSQLTRTHKPFAIKKSDFKLIGIGIISIFALIGSFELLINFILNNYLPGVNLNTPYDFFESDNIGILIIAFFLVSILAPLAEEFFYRWNIINNLRYGNSNSATVFLSALIFAFAHSAVDLNYSFGYFIIHFIATFIVGLILGVLFILTKNVLSTILIHGFWNLFLASSAFFSYFGVEAIFNIIYIILVSTCGIVFLGLIIYYSSKGYWKKLISFLNRKPDQRDSSVKPKENDVKIKLRWSWFELILGYFLLICLIPWILNLLVDYFSMSGSVIPIVYYLILATLAMLLLIRSTALVQINQKIVAQMKLEQEKIKIEKLESPDGDTEKLK